MMTASTGFPFFSSASLGAQAVVVVLQLLLGPSLRSQDVHLDAAGNLYLSGTSSIPAAQAHEVSSALAQSLSSFSSGFQQHSINLRKASISGKLSAPATWQVGGTVESGELVFVVHLRHRPRSLLQKLRLAQSPDLVYELKQFVFLYPSELSGRTEAIPFRNASPNLARQLLDVAQKQATRLHQHLGQHMPRLLATAGPHERPPLD